MAKNTQGPVDDAGRAQGAPSAGRAQGAPSAGRAQGAQNKRTNFGALGERLATGPRMGWADLIGAEIVQAEEGSVVVELEASERHHHPGGVVQGGIITAIADAAMGISLMTAQPAGEANTTIELKINFIRPVTHGRVRAVGKVVEIRKSLLFSEADVFDEEGRLVAHATSTCIAIPRAWPAE